MSKEDIDWQLHTFNELNTCMLYDILRLREKVFALEQNCLYQDIDGLDDIALHLTGSAAGKPIAYARLLKPGDPYKEAGIGRILTAAEYRGKGIGKALVRRAIRTVEQKFGRTDIRIAAQCYLENFYREFGFRPMGDSYLLDDIPHLDMYFRFFDPV